MLPTNRLTTACIASIQRKYDTECNLQKLVTAREFQYFYDKSRATSIDVNAHIAGLSPHQYSRITAGKSFPPFEVVTEARTRLEFHFGSPDVNLSQVRSTKRQRAAEIVISETAKRPIKSTASSPHVGTIARKVTALLDRIEPPSHSVLKNDDEFHEWRKQLRILTGEEDENVVDAITAFTCAREFLAGFLESINFRSAILAKRQDNIAIQLCEDLCGFRFVHAAFRASDGCLKKVRRNLLRITGLAATSRSNDRDFVNEILSNWQLTIQDFLSPTATVGFLVMESAVVRSRVIHVLNNSATAEAGS